MDPKTGLYSKAAQIIRGLQQERGTADQFIGAARKLGLKDAELEHAGRLPQGPISRDELADIFEARKPSLRIDQYGANPSYLSREEQRERLDLQRRNNSFTERVNNPLTSEEEARHRQLSDRLFAGPNVLERQDEEDEGEEPTQYESYRSDGTQAYRERLLKLPSRNKDPVSEAELRLARAKDTLWHHETGYGADHPVTQQSRANAERLQAELEQAKRLYGEPRPQPEYQSSHWSDHPNVLAHIRLSDREIAPPKEQIEDILQRMAAQQGLNSWKHLASGAIGPALIHKVITPEEAAEVSRFMGWRNGYDQGRGLGKRLLHVEELQSDWAQEGRDKGFHDPQNPFEIFDTKTGKTISKHPTYSAMWDAYRSIPEDQAAGLDYGNAADEKRPPAAPYVTNTQHWTDLALKNVLREAALGNYDGIVFPTGQNQADRYGLEKHVDKVMYDPGNRVLKAVKDGNSVVNRQNVGPEDLPGLIGHDVTKRLLHPDNTFNAGDPENQFHMLQGDDLKMGGQGMKGYYDGIVPKAVMKLARQHDPNIQPAEPVTYMEDGETYQGFHLPMTDDLKKGILDKGYPAFRRGGSVDAALSVTRRFTKDGVGAMMRLKP